MPVPLQTKAIFLGGGSSGSGTFDNPCTPGSTIFVFAFDGGGINKSIGASDPTNGAYTNDAHANLATDGDTIAWLHKANAASTALTVTVTGTNLSGFALLEYAGVAASSPFDQTAAGNSTGTAASSGNTPATTVASELVLAGVGVSNSGNGATASGGKTLRTSDANAHIWTEDLTVAATGSYSGDFALSATDEWAVLTVTYKLTSGAALSAAAADSSSATDALTTQIKAAAGAADTTSATGALAAGGGAALAAGAADSSAATAALTTAIKAASAAADTSSATGALTNFASVTLASPLYNGVGGILDPNFWVGSVPGIGTVVWYDPTHIIIATNGEISADTNDCQAVVQFFDGTSWWVGLVVITPNMVAYPNVATAAAGILTTAIQMAAAATSLSSAAGALTTQIRPASAAATVTTAAAALTTAIQLLSAAIDTTTASGELPGGAAALASSATDGSSSNAALSTAIKLGALATDVTSAAGALSTAIVLATAAASSSSATGNLAGNQVVLAASAGNSSAAAAVLTTLIKAQAAAADLSTAGAALSTQIRALSNAVDTSVAHADFSTFDPIASSASTITAATAALTALIRLASAAISSSAASGALSTAVQLSVAAQTAESIAATLGNVPRVHLGSAVIIAISNTVQGARQAYIEKSECQVAATFFDAAQAPYIPQALRYRIDDVRSGAAILDWTALTSANSVEFTVSSAQNAMISLTRSHEAHQVLIEITDDYNDVSYARTVFDLYRVVGLN